MRNFQLLVGVLFCLLLSDVQARVALLIGNNAYSNPTFPALDKAVSDAGRLADKLESLGFRVIKRNDLNAREMREAIREFHEALKANNEVGLFYYAGHGMQIEGDNFLIPLKTHITSEYEVEPEAIKADLVLNAMFGARTKINLVILDACRDNAFATRGGKRGLAAVSRENTFIAYATQPNKTAEDGTFMDYLSKWITEPLSIDQMFKKVINDVRDETRGEQVPSFNYNLIEDFFLNWQNSYFENPMNSDSLISYEKKYQSKKLSTAIIAVFLPETGVYANVAKAIKDGLVSAYNLAKQEKKANEELRFYNTDGSNIVSLYRKAMNDGARLIIGPLNKKYLRTLVNEGQLSIPVLALNHIEGLKNPYLYQFGLSYIDKAEQIAYKARQDGYHNALLLIPKSKAGNNTGKYFARHWQRLGGNILNIQTYDSEQEDFTSTIEQLINNNASGKIPDVVVMSAYPQQANSLKIHLSNYSATANLPVYATYELYLGFPSPARDSDLNGITFCDIPWVFNQIYTGSLSNSTLRSIWVNLPSSYLRLVPLGIDAYHLSHHLGRLQEEPFSGATGRLTLGNNNKINQEFFCAQFINGKPKLLNFTSKIPPKYD